MVSNNKVKINHLPLKYTLADDKKILMEWQVVRNDRTKNTERWLSQYTNKPTYDH